MRIDLKGFNELYKQFSDMPQEVEERLKLDLTKSLRDIKERAKEHHRFISRTGETEREIRYQTNDLEGRVFLNSQVGVYQHEGTGIYGVKKRAITITPKHKLALRWAKPSGSGFIFAKKATIKGIKPDPFLFKAAEHEKPIIINRFAASIQEVLDNG